MANDFWHRSLCAAQTHKFSEELIGRLEPVLVYSAKVKPSHANRLIDLSNLISFDFLECLSPDCSQKSIRK